MTYNADRTGRESTSALEIDLPIHDAAAPEWRGGLHHLVGSSRSVVALGELLRQAAPSSASVLIAGESGTGKELVARLIHKLSPRRDAPFVAINCAAFPESLLESEIFGHEKGAFTGATFRRPGCFETANGGTLFLDEVSEMSPATQVKLLRVLEERTLRRLGGGKEIAVDVRVVAATNRDPVAMVSEGSLREDIYYRLNVFTVHLSPLRERLDDLPLLADHFLRRFSKDNGKTVDAIDEEAMSILLGYSWPGNVRELRNVIQRAVILAPGRRITVNELPPRIVAPLESAKEPESPPPAPLPAPEGHVLIPKGSTLEEAKRLLILKTLETTGNNKSKAADLLGISVKTLYNKLNEWNMRSTPRRPDETDSRSRPSWVAA